MMFKRDFHELGYLEKLFLIMFSKNNNFKNSIGNIYTNDNLFNHRKKNYPLFFFFHLYSEKTEYKFINLKILKKFFTFFKKPIFENKTFIKIKNTLYAKNSTDQLNFKYKNYLLFLIFQNYFYKRYYNLCSSIFFKKNNLNNLVKLNWVFYIFLKSSLKKHSIYDLSKYTDWYSFFFKNFKFSVKKKLIVEKNKKKLFTKFKENNKNYLTNIYKKYNLFFKKINYTFDFFYKNIFTVNYKKLNLKKNKLNLNLIWKKSLNYFYPVRFGESSINKNVELKNINNYLFFYIRKNRIFNKGRYSRNRQLYRTGVYWCLWLNIILVYGLYFLFYRFTFNFGYFWWGLLILFYSTIFSRAIKYNYHNFYKIFLELINLVNWLGLIYNSLIKGLFDFFYIFKNYIFKNYIFFKIITFFYNFYKNLTKNKIIYFWEDLNYEDTSLFKYKTLIHWINQFVKTITY